MFLSSKGKTLPLLFIAASACLTAAPRLGVSTTTVNTITAGAGGGVPQSVEAFNLGDGALNLTATSTATWLVPTIGAARACTTRSGNCLPVSIALNTSTLAAGVYTDYVTLTDPNALDSPQEIAVTVTVGSVPSSVSAYVPPIGSANATMLIPVYTAGTGVTAQVATASGGNWLQFVSGNGIVNLGVPWVIQVSSQIGQAVGSYNGTVNITNSSVASDKKTIAVTLNVTTSPIVQTSAISQVRLTAGSGGTTQFGVVTLNNLGLGSLNVTSVTSSASFLTGTVSNGQTLVLFANPAGLSAGVYRANVTIQSNAANNSAVSIPVELVVTPAGKPLISTGGIVNIATGAQEAVSQGEIVSVYGTELAPAGTSASNQGAPPLATTLGGVQVLVNNVPAPLFYVSPGQINFQIPYSVTPGSTASIQVVSQGSAGNSRAVSVSANQPRLLTLNAFVAGNYGIIVNNGDGSIPAPSGTVIGGLKTHPAKPGDTIVIYGIGFGQTTPGATEGAAAVGLQSIGTATATLGAAFQTPVSVTAGYAGLTPTAVGLYQFNVTLPLNAPIGGSIPLAITANGQQSNVVSLAISASGQ